MAATCGRELLRAELEALPTKDLYLRGPSTRREASRCPRLLDPAQKHPRREAAAGEVEEAQADVRSGIARLNDLRERGGRKSWAKR